ncbi:hypothetical protein EBZ37_13085, partial [bacterium]|nr:hypothetical protein [bacterium]
MAVPNGSIDSLETDGQYAYIAGSFTKICKGGEAGFTAINPTTGENLNLNMGDFDGPVRDILVTSDAIYVAGFFMRWKNYSRSCLAKFDLQGNIDETFDPAGDFQVFNNALPEVRTIALNGSTLYAGGRFNHASGEQHLVKLSAVTAQVDSQFGRFAKPSGTSCWAFPSKIHYSDS